MPSSTLIDLWVFGPERGCLMRAVPVIQALHQADKNIRFRLFVHKDHLKIVHKVLPVEDFKAISYGRGLRFSYNKNFDIKIFSTIANIAHYATWGFVKHYFLFRRSIKIDRPIIVLNDFMPLTPLFGLLHDLPVIGLYNYVLKETSLGNSLVRRVLSASILLAYNMIYALHTKLFIEQLLPEKDISGRWESVPVIARETTADSASVRALLGVDPDQKLVFLSLGGGGSTSPKAFLEKFSLSSHEPSWKMLISPRSIDEANWIRSHYPDFILSDPEDFETQNLIAASDLIITRAGFTTVAEAVQHNVPLLIWSMKIHPEIRETEQMLKKLGAATDFLRETDSPEELKEKIRLSLENKRAKEEIMKLPRSGADVAVKNIMQYLSALSGDLS